MFSSIPPFTLRPTLRTSIQTRASVSTFAEPIRTKPSKTSLYEILRVDKTASLMEIKTAYRSLAKLCHPDASVHHKSDGQDFMEIHNAYETLSDPASRALYDLSISESMRIRRRGGGFYPTRRWETDQCW